MKQLVLAVILTMWAVTAHAVNWVKIIDGPETEFFIDSETIEFGSNTVTYWEMINYVKAQKIGNKPFFSSVIKQKEDLESHTHRLLYVSFYSGPHQSGEMFDGTNFADISSPDPVIPGTNGAYFHDVLKALYDRALSGALDKVIEKDLFDAKTKSGK